MEANVRINRRSGHVVVAYKNNMILWGGYMECSDESHTRASKYHSSDEVWIYNTSTDVWIRGLTKGDIPSRNSGACGVVLDDHMYVFGGYQCMNGLEVGNSNRLFRLNLNNLTWEHLLPEGIPPPPCDKLVGWAYSEKIYFFGGFGPSLIGPNNSRYSYITDTSTINSDWPGRGWNNQFVCYNVSKNSWEWPESYGPKPGPRAAHAADISGSTVYIFGGRTCQIRKNELHVLDMKTMTWSGDLKANVSTSQCVDWPEGRSWHTLTFISPNTAILYGGLNQFNVVLSDCWKLIIKSKNNVIWEPITIYKDVPLLWHKAAYFPCNSELYLLGGFKKCFLSQLISWTDHTDTVLMIPFAPKSLLRICLDFIIKNGIVYEHEFELPSTLMHVIDHRRRLENDEITTICYSKERDAVISYSRLSPVSAIPFGFI